MFRKYALIALAATVAVGASMLAPTTKAEAAQWACGSVNQYTCHDLPCAIGETSSSVDGKDHCVAAIAVKPAMDRPTAKIPNAREPANVALPTTERDKR